MQILMLNVICRKANATYIDHLNVHAIDVTWRQRSQGFRLNTTMIDIANKPVRPVTGPDVTIQLQAMNGRSRLRTADGLRYRQRFSLTTYPHINLYSCFPVLTSSWLANKITSSCWFLLRLLIIDSVLVFKKRMWQAFFYLF